MNPDPIAQRNSLARWKRLRRDSRPTDCKQSVLASHPCGRIVWMLGIHENGCTTQMRRCR